MHWVGFGGKDGDELESRYRGLERAERGHLVARVPRDCADYVGELLLVGDVGGEVLEAALVDGARGQCTVDKVTVSITLILTL